MKLVETVKTPSVLILILMLLPTLLLAQAGIDSALKERVNLAPRSQRGESQVYLVDIRSLFLNDEGTPTHLKRDKLAFTMLCLANSPETGMEYQVTIDSLMVGQKLPLNMKDRGRSEAKQFRGMSFSYSVNQDIPVKDGCYDFYIEFPEGLRYSQSYELMEYFTGFTLIERMRYAAGRNLDQIGDQVTIKLPAPVCYDIPMVLESTETRFSSFNLSFDGYALNRNDAAALITINPLFAKTSLKLLQPDTTNYVMVGTVAHWGEFQVRLSDGDIVSAKIYDRIDGKMTPAPPGFAEEPRSSAYRTITLQQIN